MNVVASKRKQSGITLVGFIIVMVVAGFFAYMGMILGPAYSEYYGVVKAINFVAGEATPNTTDFEPLRKGLDRQFNVGYVESVTGKDAKLIRDKTGNILSMTYEVRKPFLYNIDFVVKFSHSQPLGSKTAGD
ncbi:MAG: DUF4845 domain-containing protein [Gammaproteobacteria bacterium]|nr:DUF4845 domain-containing protein [Gammaproteobacteria bacterium]